MSDFDLTDDEVALVESDAAQMIDADDTTAEVWKPTVEGEEEFDGPFESAFTLSDVIGVDFQIQPSSEVLEPDCNAIADAHFEAGVAKRYRLVIDGLRYVVRHVQPFRAFGSKTHRRLQLWREYP